MLPDREIHVVDSRGASMAEGILARLGVELAADGRPAEDIAATLEARGPDMRIYVALETLDYLRKGGRISGAQAAIGTLLSVKPIIRVRDGVVDTVDRVRTRSKARERLIELICERPIERLAILHTISPDVEAFRDAVLDRAPGGLDPADVTIDLVGASVGPHLGPGCVGAAILVAGPERGTGPASGPATAGNVAARLRQDCRPVPSGRRGSPPSGYTRDAHESRAGHPRSVLRDPAARPVGSSGRRPNDGGPVTARHVRTHLP